MFSVVFLLNDDDANGFVKHTRSSCALVATIVATAIAAAAAAVVAIAITNE